MVYSSSYQVEVTNGGQIDQNVTHEILQFVLPLENYPLSLSTV